jgi:hypothetical protein
MSEHHRTSSWSKTVEVTLPRLQAKCNQARHCLDCARLSSSEASNGARAPRRRQGRHGTGLKRTDAQRPVNRGPTHGKKLKTRSVLEFEGGRELKPPTQALV